MRIDLRVEEGVARQESVEVVCEELRGITQEAVRKSKGLGRNGFTALVEVNVLRMIDEEGFGPRGLESLNESGGFEVFGPSVETLLDGVPSL
ncbi:MAG: hypothetical protein QXH08_04850 [Candidatus Hadarchaeales archaeon]|jgi:hypothetical protein